jgi:hypothetical protein
MSHCQCDPFSYERPITTDPALTLSLISLADLPRSSLPKAHNGMTVDPHTPGHVAIMGSEDLQKINFVKLFDN